MIGGAARATWRAIRLLWAAGERYFQHNGPDRAAAVAFYTLLSLMPLLIFLISVGVAVMGSFDAAFSGTLFLINGVVVPLDPRSLEALRSFVERAAILQGPGVLLLAWTGRRIFVSLFSALENIFGMPGRSIVRAFARGNLRAFAMVLVAGVALLATLALATAIATAEGLLGRMAGGTMALDAFRTLTGLVLTRLLPSLITFGFAFIVYRAVPRKLVTTRNAALGALVATLLWEGAKTGFAWYVRNLARYVGLYGALEAVIVLALWLELSISIILFGAEIVALLSQQNGKQATPA